MTKTKLEFKKGDKVTGLVISDIVEAKGVDVLNRIETVTKIVDDGDGYFFIETDYTKTFTDEVTKENKEKKEDDEISNGSWYINAETQAVQVINEIKPENLDKVGAVLEGEFVVFDYMEIPVKLLLTLKPFVDALSTKEIEEIIDTKDGVVLTIEGIELSTGMLRTIFGK